MVRISALAALVVAWVAFIAGPALAGTTGAIHGRVVDSASGAPISGAKITASSPSQVETVTSDAGGAFVFISLSPDTYTITASKDGYDTASLPGITVVADQARNIGVTLQKTLKTIGTVTTRATASLVRPGTTSDVYSINAATQKASAALAGSGSLNQAYGSVASAPGVVYQQGQQGWYQSIFIRGGDIDQTAYEVDGIPVMRVSDSATVTSLSTLGQQEMQVYTGGTPASADASGIAGYINQVIKTGTYPGYEDLKLGVGGPALYNSVQFEGGGATPDRRFSYYVGEALTAQGYRYGDQFNGASDPLFFMPAYIPSDNGASVNGGCSVAPCVYDGNTSNPLDPSGKPVFSPGISDAIASTHDYETVANFHYQIPHKNDPLRDDVQVLYIYSNLLQKFYTSLSDLGLSSVPSQSLVESVFGCAAPCPITYLDQTVYNGPVFAPPNPSFLATANFPNSGVYRPPFQLLPVNEREGSQNGSGIEKVQFQKNIDEKTYLRIFGYAEDSWWWISGPVSANLTYGDQLPDYEVDGHTYGGDIIFSKQLSDKHLINATASYFTSKLETYSMGFQAGNFTSLIDSAGNCYNYTTGEADSCFDAGSQGGAFNGLTPGTPPAGTPGALANAQWIVTENGQNAQIDEVRPYFSAVSATDSWRPNDKLSFTLGLRVENFRYGLEDLASAYPARQFWFNAYNSEFCWGPGYPATVDRFNFASNTFTPCSAMGPGLKPVNLQNYHGGTISETVPQPRFGMTYEVNADNVIRASYGRYARPAPTSYQEYNTIQQDLPSFLATFVPNGWNTPVHNIFSDTSINTDLSWEHHFPNTTLAMKLTPFLRTTQGQLQFSALNAQGVVAGVNAGKQVSDGLEVALNKGSFASDGLSWALSATYTRSRIQYGPYPSGLNVIDLLNEQIQLYNSYTSACASVAPSQNPTSLCGINFNTATQGPNALPVEPNGITNPYYNAKPQPLLDPHGWYTTYDEIPSPFSNAIGFETPFQMSLVLNWKSGPLTVTPNLLYSTQGKYGSPLVWPGYDPNTCSGSGVANPQTCTGYIFIPDKYTGVFDNLGAFQEPNRLTANMSIGYEFSKHLTTTLTVANLIDHCYQRNVPWANGPTCQYAQLQSNLLPPAGNFVTNPPIQLAYPYGSWYNNLEIAQMGQRNPIEATLEFEVRP